MRSARMDELAGEWVCLVIGQCEYAYNGCPCPASWTRQRPFDGDLRLEMRRSRPVPHR